MHGTGYGNGIQIFGAYILQIGILHCGSIDGYNCILGVVTAAAVGQRKISIVIEGAVAVAVAMHSGQFQLVLTLLLLVYLSETFQIRRRQQQ